MSYTEQPGLPVTPMVYDIWAIQYLYGANMSYHAGDDTYTLGTSLMRMQTIWDAGGNDTITMASAGTLDLHEGALSTIGGITYGIAYGAQIENGVGGAFADTIIGNSAANSLVGQGGEDTILGEAGNDTILAGAGNDFVQRGGGQRHRSSAKPAATSSTAMEVTTRSTAATAVTCWLAGAKPTSCSARPTAIRSTGARATTS